MPTLLLPSAPPWLIALTRMLSIAVSAVDFPQGGRFRASKWVVHPRRCKDSARPLAGSGGCKCGEKCTCSAGPHL
ncbi:exported protein of unknown function [Cupriavidus taiwanensis]|nr:exported protein of unknown function [Cupriavidus taiwanensis]